MLFGKLLPREGNFFELFNQHGDHIVEGARAFILLIQNYADPELREKYAERGRQRRAPGRPHHRRGEPAAAQDLHHADRPRADPQPDQRDGRHPRPAAGRDRDDVAVRRARDDRGRAAPRRPERQVLRARAARGVAAAQASASHATAEAAIKTCEEIDKLESDADRVMRSAMSQAVPRRDRRARADQAEDDLRAARVDLRPLRGRGEPDRGRRPRELLTLRVGCR